MHRLRSKTVGSNSLAAAQHERDLYYCLLELRETRQIEPGLKQALALVAEITDARQVYLELYEEGGESRPRRHLMTHGFSPRRRRDARAAISRGIIAASLAAEKTIVTESARFDQRFSGNQSVRRNRIEAVLCAPIGSSPPCGVLYLQGRLTAGQFSDDDRRRVEIVVRHLTPMVERLLGRGRTPRGRAVAVGTPRDALDVTGLAGHGPAFEAILEQVAVAAALEAPVLITGEEGVGKSHLARVIHNNSPRAGAPFVEVNCASLPEPFGESELFGAVPSGGAAGRPSVGGKVAAAAGGTLFLDNVSLLPLPAQNKILQLLRHRQYHPLGSRTPLSADVRLIAAAGGDLRNAVVEHRFREDLFYALQVLMIRVPSLAERRQDVAELVGAFCATACARHALPDLELSPTAVRAAEEADWPGNLRQLACAVEAAVLRAASLGAPAVTREHLFPDAGRPAAPDATTGGLQDATRRFQARLLREALSATDWNIAETAQRLGIARSYVYKLIRALDLKRT